MDGRHLVTFDYRYFRKNDDDDDDDDDVYYL